MPTELEQQITSKTYLKEGTTLSLYQTSDDNISSFIDIIRYDFIRSVTHQIKQEFRQSFYKLEINEQLRLSKLDKTSSLLAMSIESIMFNGIPPDCVISDENNTLVDAILVAINISTSNLDKIPDNDELLYRYFVNASIKPEQVNRFRNPNFQKNLTNRLLTEERVLFTSITNNLITMMETDALNPASYHSFFKDLFKRETHIQGEQKNLFRLAVSKEPRLLDELISVRLLIDPFSKQTNFSTWLNHTQKYLFLAEIAKDSISKNPTPSTNATLFLEKLSCFNEVFKHDRSILQRK